MQFLQNIGYAVMIMLGVYLTIMLSYILIPAIVFLFILYVVHTARNLEEED